MPKDTTTTKTEVKLDPAATAPPVNAQVAKVDLKMPMAPPREETGFEDFTQSDLAVPFLIVLQKGHPQVEDGNPKQVVGAKAGMLMNTVTNELYDGKVGVEAILVHRVHNFLEWIPRDDGGGLVNVFAANAPEVLDAQRKAGRKFGKLKINDNNDLVETFNVFCLLTKPDGRRERCVLGFSSTNIGPYKRWMTQAMSQTHTVEGGGQAPIPMWGHRYRITTQFNQKKSNTWYTFNVTFADGSAEKARIPDDAPESSEAKDFRALLTSGAATANFESATRERGADEEGDGYTM